MGLYKGISTKKPLTAFSAMANCFPGKYDCVIVGGGLAGATLAKEIHKNLPHLSLLVIEKEEAPGGVWNVTRWPWLKSDTMGWFYSPADQLSEVISKGLLKKGVPRETLLTWIKEHLLGTPVWYNTEVTTMEWNIVASHWTLQVKGNPEVTSVRSRWVILATGIYGNPHIPSWGETVGKSLIHARDLDINKLPRGGHIAVVGSRESGTQIVGGLQERGFKVTWIARSFKQWYLRCDRQPKWVEVLMSIIKWVPFIALWKWVRKTLILMLHMSLIKYLKQIIVQKKDPSLKQAFWKEGPSMRYHPSQPLRPVFTSKIDLTKVKRIEFPNGDEDFKKHAWDEYDAVIMATGYRYQQNIRIIFQGENKPIDVANLINYVFPPIPNCCVCLPIAVSSWVMLEEMVNTVVKHLKKYAYTYKIPHPHEWQQHKKEREDFFQKWGISQDDITFHTRHPTFIYASK